MTEILFFPFVSSSQSAVRKYQISPTNKRTNEQEIFCCRKKKSFSFLNVCREMKKKKKCEKKDKKFLLSLVRAVSLFLSEGEKLLHLVRT